MKKPVTQMSDKLVTEQNKINIQEEAHTTRAKLYLGKNIFDTDSSATITMGRYLENIQDETYQEYTFRIAAILDKSERQEEKKKVPAVCISGHGYERTNAGINIHSGYIGIDLDDIDADAIKKLLTPDPYFYAIFKSVSTKGLCVIVKIDGTRHEDSFYALQDFFFNKYGLLVDEQCVNVARARYVSHDAEIYRNEASKVFKQYLKKEPVAIKKEKTAGAVVVNSDFENIILKEIEERKIDLVPSYGIWRNVAFALANEFGAAGEDYFHRISAFGHYKEKICKKQYEACLAADIKNETKEKKTTLNYFYKLCEAAGISVESEQTAFIKKAAYSQRQAGVSKESVVKNLHQFNNLSPDVTTSIVSQVYDKDIYVADVTDMECIREFLKAHYTLRINEITNRLEHNGKELTNYEMHSIELAIKEKFPKTDYTTISKILDSNFISKYNPFFEFFAKYMDRGKPGSIAELFACIESNTGGDIKPDYPEYFGTKWMVGMIACLYKNVSPLMLILCGRDQGTGKTYFFENLLPEELKKYATLKNLSSLTSDTFKRDMDIAISRYLLIYDDEMAGKSKRDQGAIKALLSTGSTSVRAAYARGEETRKRIAAFGGTTNDLQILGDHTGNRRNIPIEVLSIDFERKDRIDPIDYIMEAYHLYHSGFNYTVLGRDMKILNECTAEFNQVSIELEMVLKFYTAPDKYSQENYVTGTDIKNKLELNCREKLNPNKLSAALKMIGIEGERKKVKGVNATWYNVVEKDLTKKPEFEKEEQQLEVAPF